MVLVKTRYGPVWINPAQVVTVRPLTAGDYGFGTGAPHGLTCIELVGDSEVISTDPAGEVSLEIAIYQGVTA